MTRETDVGSYTQSSLETILRSLVIRIAVEQHSKSNLHVRIDVGELLALSLDTSRWTRPSGDEEQVDNSVVTLPRRSDRIGNRRESDGRVGEGKPPFESRKGTNLLSFVDIGDSE